jgi:DNA modification methylase
MIKIINDDNLRYLADREIDLVYADMIYENMDFSWILHYWYQLRVGGIFMIQTDWHSVFEVGKYMNDLFGCYFINHVVWKNEWGNHPKDRFHQCFDDILIFSKGKHTKFYSDRIQVPKATAKTKLNPSGRETKTATAFIDDICLTTTSKERVKKSDGHLIKWQKPLRLMDRLLLPFTDEGDFIVDPFSGSGTTALWCKKNNRDCVAIEIDPETFRLSLERLETE